MNRRDLLKLTSLAAGSLYLDRVAPALPGEVDEHAEASLPGELYDSFARPAMKYRPLVRWWWNGDRITSDELLRELDVLRAAGLGGVEINPIRFPDEADAMGIPSLAWLSDEWIDMLKVALDGAKQRGMTADMIVGSGWPYGGEFLAREDQTQIVALGTKKLSGPQQIQMSRQELLDMVRPAFGFPYKDPLKEVVDVRLVPATLNDLRQSIALEEKIANGSLSIDVPAGEHVLYCLVKITGFMAVINGAPGASGPVLNHYDEGAVQRYLDHLSTRLLARLGPLSNYFRAFFTDSIELEGANWCSDMAAQFRQRRGYELTPWLPFILFEVGEMGNAVAGDYGAKLSPDLKRQTELVRFDFETTRHELFQERFIQTFARWCTRLNVKSRMQAYGMDCDPIASGMLVDIPECETWIRSETVEEFGTGDYTRGRSYTMINKFVSSAAHLAGKTLISAEDMTNTDDPFHTTLERIKIAGDQSMLTGVTHSVLHGFNYSPLDAPFPGWVRYGTYFSERNPWWPYFHLWTDYKTRLSALFQQAVMQADIAILPPMADLSERYGFQRDPFPKVAYPPYIHKVWEAIHQNGNGCDYVSEEVIQKSRVEKGQLRFNQRAYEAIVFPAVESIRPETASVLKQFADGGGKLIFIEKTPHLSDGLVKYAERSREVEHTVQSILKNNPKTTGVISINEQDMVGWFRGVQQKFALKPAVAIDPPADFMSQLHYVAGNRDIFFFTNYGPTRTGAFEAVFNTGDKTAWLWDAETGERRRYPAAGAVNRLSITLEPSESMLIVFEPASAESDTANSPSLPLPPRPSDAAGAKILEGPWQVTLSHVNGTSEMIDLAHLEDFNQDPHLKSFAGTATYRKAFRLDKDKDRYWLDLGRVHGVSEVELNGIPVGVRWFGDHVYDISHALVPGENHLSIKIVTTLGNYMKTLKHNRAAEVWTSNTPFLPLGLVGPVRLRSAK